MAPHHPRSPSPNLLQNHINSPRINDSFPHSSQIMYNNSHFTSEFSQSDSDLRKQPGKNGFLSYRSTPFNPYNRHPQSSNNYPSSYPQDSYSPQAESHLSQARYDIGTSQAFDDSKQSYVGTDQYGNAEAGPILLNNQPNLSPNPQSQTSYSQIPFLTGLTHVQSQTPYGPHVSGPLNQTTVNSSSVIHQANGTGQHGLQQEEISTIFVVGFPDDMQEREFQNMFSFSSGFEAATLKIPNKEFTSYGSNANGIARYQSSYNGSNDPYNLVTMNQGGVVVDNGRDGTTSSWPTSSEEAHYLSSTVPQPARKQIIGFAKFRTRQEALEARDILQGRRVDVEKGAVLKAEMAKKNLHTKRGPAAAPPGLTSIVGAGASAGESGAALNGIQNEPLSAREREIVTLGAMGLGSRRDRVLDLRDPDEDRDRRTAATRGARERAEEDERERERKRQEKDAARLRSATFDAFHSVPPPRLMTQNSFPLPSGNSVSQSSTQDGFSSSVWGMTSKETTARKFIAPIGVSDVSSRAVSPQNDIASPQKHAPSLGSSRSVGSDDSSGHLSPSSNVLSLPPHPSLPLRPRPLSPTSLQYSSMPSSSASSADGFGSDGERTKQGAGLTISTDELTSPQSVSSSSGPGGTSAPAASARGNPGDQNPPINTLYVGNLPSSPPPGNYLEDELRELFGRRPGYRKLCFRQKNNGPMCFVEFEDVRHATKALNELHGNTLNGLVKSGGIRLSYSKNPLGVRTPAGAIGATSQHQHQQFKDSMHSAPPSSGVFPSESFNRESSQTHRPVVTLARRDMTSQQHSYQYTTSPPAPRFSSPTSTHYPASTTLSTFPRSQYGLDTMNTSSTFSPFRISSTSPRLDQFGADMNERFGHILSPPPVNGIETSRAG